MPGQQCRETRVTVAGQRLGKRKEAHRLRETMQSQPGKHGRRQDFVLRGGKPVLLRVKRERVRGRVPWAGLAWGGQVPLSHPPATLPMLAKEGASTALVLEPLHKLLFITFYSVTLTLTLCWPLNKF